MFMRRIPTQAERYLLAYLRWISNMELGKCDPNWRDAFHYAAIVRVEPIVFAEEAGLIVSIPSFHK